MRPTPSPLARSPRNRPRAVQGVPSMARNPRLRSVAAASARSAASPAPSAAFAAPGAALAPTSPAALTRTPCLALLGPRPLIDGEDGTNYDVILERISADVAPADFVEEVCNVVDLVWESIRLRRLKSQLLHAAAHEGLARARPV